MSKERRGFKEATRFLRARLSPEGFLGLHLTVGMLLIILTGWCFSEIAEDFAKPGWLASMDRNAADAFHSIVTPNLTRFVRSVTFLGSVGFVSAISAAVVGVLVWRKAFYPLRLFVLTMLGGSILNVVLKHLFHRHRPVLENPLVTLSSYGFPSGHTMGSTMFWGCLAILAATTARHWQARVLWFVGAGIWVAIIGATRIYLGAHYFTDVIGAVAAGSAWLALCWTAVVTLRQWRLRDRPRRVHQDARS